MGEREVELGRGTTRLRGTPADDGLVRCARVGFFFLFLVPGWKERTANLSPFFLSLAESRSHYEESLIMPRFAAAHVVAASALRESADLCCPLYLFAAHASARMRREGAG